MAENFVVSARKYRPVTFDTVVGQSHITTTLKNAVGNNHLAQAFLFCGPRGVGKTTTARILAKTINCTNLGADVEPCGKCENCVAFQNNASFNVHELDAASNNSVDDIRNLIDQVRYPPQSGRYKIYIIDEVHMLSAAAFNAFLKTLEEPPSYAIFILATTEKHKILPTILSRCQIFDFNRIQVKDMADHLANIAAKENVTAEREALELIAQKADGGLRDALSMFDLNVTFSTDNVLRYQEVINNLHVLDYDYYFQLTNELITGNLPKSLLVFDEILRKGFDGHLFVVGMLEHFRNLLVCKDASTIQLLEVSEIAKSKYLDQSQKADMSFLLSALSIGSQTDIHFKTAKNQRLHVELCLMKLAFLNQVFVPEIKETTQVISEPVASYGANTTGTIAVPLPPVQSGKLRTTVSLSPTPLAVPKTESLSQTESQTIRTENHFTREQLVTSWYKFIEIRQKGGANKSEKVMLDREIQLENTTIKINLDNQIQENILNEVRFELVNFLRAELSNAKISIEYSIVVQENTKNLYSPQSRFSAMAERNANLIELQKMLGLEVDY